MNWRFGVLSGSGGLGDSSISNGEVLLGRGRPIKSASAMAWFIAVIVAGRAGCAEDSGAWGGGGGALFSFRLIAQPALMGSRLISL